MSLAFRCRVKFIPSTFNKHGYSCNVPAGNEAFYISEIDTLKEVES